MNDSETYTRLIARCNEYGDCLLWGGCRTNTGYPQVSVDGTKRLVRRLVFALCTGVEVPAGMAVTVTCGEKLCINHEHMALRTTQQVAKLAAKRGAFSKPDRCAAISRGCRKSANAKLTEEQAAEIRASTGQLWRWLRPMASTGRPCRRSEAARRGEHMPMGQASSAGPGGAT